MYGSSDDQFSRDITSDRAGLVEVQMCHVSCACGYLKGSTACFPN